MRGIDDEEIIRRVKERPATPQEETRAVAWLQDRIMEISDEVPDPPDPDLDGEEAWENWHARWITPGLLARLAAEPLEVRIVVLRAELTAEQRVRATRDVASDGASEGH